MPSNEQYLSDYLEIPVLDKKFAIYYDNEEANDLEKNVEILTVDVKPGEDKSIVIAAHSGISTIAYFNGIEQLRKGDEIIIGYQNKEYVYVVDVVYNEKKDGDIRVIEKNERQYLYLTTCNQLDKSKQVVVRCIEMPK